VGCGDELPAARPISLGGVHPGSTSRCSLSPASPPAAPSALLQPLLMLGAESAPANLAMESAPVNLAMGHPALCSSYISGVEVAADGGLVPLVMSVSSLSSVKDGDGVELAPRMPLVAALGHVSDVLPVSCKVGNGPPPARGVEERLGVSRVSWWPCSSATHFRTQPGLQAVGARKMLPVPCSRPSGAGLSRAFQVSWLSATRPP
jgi:hypothetical protein